LVSGRKPTSRRDARIMRPSFVLADAIVATVMLGAALSVIVSLVGRALAAQRVGERLEVVAMLLDEQLQMVVARGPDNYLQRFPANGKCDIPFADYEYQLAITSNGSADAYSVKATISWREGSRLLNESVETRVAPRRGDEPDPDRKPAESVVRQ
jgi:type II secretory pathway pseudopilin PulG